MNRSRVIRQAIFLAFLGAIVPLALMGFLSWERAQSKEQALLAAYASRSLQNTRVTLRLGAEALQKMEAWNGTPCSPEHLEQMRLLTFNSHTVEEIGYFDDGFLRCTSWGSTAIQVPRLPGDFTTADGIQVTLRMQPLVTHGDAVTALLRGNYNVLINANRLADVIVDDDVRIAVLHGTQVVSELRAPERSVVDRVATTAGTGMDRHYLFAVSQADGWTAVALRDRGKLGTSLLKELVWLLPIGVFVGGFIVFLVVRLSRKRLSPLAELAIAVERREFVVFYQPIIELKTGACIGAEALVRWRRPDGSMVRPDLFIPLAEESGLICPITDQVIEAVVHELGPFLLQQRALHVAINLCAADIKSGRFLPVLEQTLAGSGVRRDQIWLEATERGFMEIDAARTTLEKARALGYAIAIDDFGTGFSSLQYLQGLPTDTLKIDKAFVDAIGTTSAPSSVIDHIIGMAKTLGLSIVAEGVETEAQAAWLRERDVEWAQGWLYARALPASEFIAFARKTAKL